MYICYRSRWRRRSWARMMTQRWMTAPGQVLGGAGELDRRPRWCPCRSRCSWWGGPETVTTAVTVGQRGVAAAIQQQGAAAKW
jgi:hypothetical protein